MHKDYFNSNNEKVPSVTTVLKIINKPFLIKWANIMGFKRMRVSDILTSASEAGTFVHKVIESDLLNNYLIYSIPKLSHRTQIVNCIKNYYIWKKYNEIKPILMEQSFTSETFGGTFDFYGEFNGKKTLLDFKTSKNIYMTMFIQLAAYVLLLEENGHKVEQVGIVSASEKRISEKYLLREDIDLYIEVYLDALRLFNNWNILAIKGGWKNEYID